MWRTAPKACSRVYNKQIRHKHGYFHINRNVTGISSWYSTQVYWRAQNFHRFERGDIIVLLRLTECDCQIVNWALAILIKGVISLKFHFVMSIIYLALWLTVSIAAWAMEGYWATLGWWMTLCFQYPKPVSLFFVTLSYLTLLHHGMVSLSMHALICGL